MNDRSNEIIKQLNRLANDRSLAPLARNKLHDAVRHIRALDQQLDCREAPRQAALDICLGDLTACNEAARDAAFGPFDSLLPRQRKLLRALHG